MPRSQLRGDWTNFSRRKCRSVQSWGAGGFLREWNNEAGALGILASRTVLGEGILAAVRRRPLLGSQTSPNSMRWAII